MNVQYDLRLMRLHDTRWKASETALYLVYQRVTNHYGEPERLLATAVGLRQWHRSSLHFGEQML